MTRLKFAILCSCLAISSPAFAKQCPSGQILRVSKGVCVTKALAIKDGVIASGEKRSRAATAAGREDKDAKARTVVAKSATAETTGRTATLTDAEAAPRTPARSPYGELRLDYFGPRQ